MAGNKIYQITDEEWMEKMPELFTGLAHEGEVEAKALELVIKENTKQTYNCTKSDIGTKLKLKPMLESEHLKGKAVFYADYEKKLGIISVDIFTAERYDNISVFSVFNLLNCQSFSDFMDKYKKGEYIDELKSLHQIFNVDYYIIEGYCLNKENRDKITKIVSVKYADRCMGKR